MNWTTIQNAIHAWFVSATGLAGANVCWSRQDAPRPTSTWISILASLETVGQGMLHIEDADAPSAGAEIEHTVRGVRRIVLSVQCFDGAAIGSGMPMSLLEQVIAKVQLPSIETALDTAGVAFHSATAIQAFGDVAGSHVEPRAVTTITLGATSEYTETDTYIESAEITGDSPAIPAFTVTIP